MKRKWLLANKWIELFVSYLQLIKQKYRFLFYKESLKLRKKTYICVSNVQIIVV